MTPTYKNNRVLDLVITRDDDSSFLSNHFVHDPGISDHYAVHFTLDVPKPANQSRVVSYRQLHKINHDLFKHDIVNSPLILSPKADLDDLCDQYDDILLNILEKHAPLKSKTFPLS